MEQIFKDPITKRLDQSSIFALLDQVNVFIKGVNLQICWIKFKIHLKIDEVDWYLNS